MSSVTGSAKKLLHLPRSNARTTRSSSRIASSAARACTAACACARAARRCMHAQSAVLQPHADGGSERSAAALGAIDKRGTPLHSASSAVDSLDCRLRLARQRTLTKACKAVVLARQGTRQLVHGVLSRGACTAACACGRAEGSQLMQDNGPVTYVPVPKREGSNLPRWQLLSTFS